MRSTVSTVALVSIASALGAACSGSNAQGGFDTSGDAAVGSDGGPSGTGHVDGSLPFGFGDGSTGGDGQSNASCPLETQFVYTLAADNTLYKFDPPSLKFTKIGTLNCPSLASPYSMAVDRTANAWVVFTDGNLFRVNTTTAACTATSYAPAQSGFYTFGMGFSSDTSGGSAETLFVSDSGQQLDGTYQPTKGLGRIDTTTLKLTTLGAYDAITARAEMTGTGDARLFGAFEGSPYVVAEINKSNAKILSQASQNAIQYPPNMSNFAFAFWGGDFWLFVGPGTSTDVFQYKPATKATAKVTSVSFEIVGAGVSTCAPTQPPK